MAALLLDVRHAVVWRGDTCVFDDLSLQIERGQSTAILGPNGAGKSTLLKMMTGEVKPEYATVPAVRILGRSQWVLSELRSQIGIVSPDLEADYLDHVPGLEVVLTGFTQSVGLHGITRRPSRGQLEKARARMAQLGLGQLQDRPLKHMSTGQRRRVFLARAMVTDPHTLVLDEPTAGLDVAADFAYRQTIRALLREGVSALLVTHHLHEIPPEVERIVLLKAGKVVADGPKESVLTSEAISELHDAEVKVHLVDGHYIALPR